MCGLKSRGNWRVEYCMKGDCIFNNSGNCESEEYCLRFDLYKRRDKNGLQPVREQDVSDNRNTVSKDGEVSKG